METLHSRALPFHLPQLSALCYNPVSQSLPQLLQALIPHPRFVKYGTVKKPRCPTTSDHQNASQTIGVITWRALVLILGIFPGNSETAAVVLIGP